MKRILFLLLAAAVLWACRPSAPLIGISCGRTSAGAASLSANYTEAVARAGGIPVIFPTVADSALAAELVRRVDGVIFSGGPDLDPSYYGETVWNETVKVDTLRDVSDLMLMRAALAAKKPIMAICRGEQLMNVVLGGSLYQDIPTQVDTLVKHAGGAWHRIGVEKGSVLYDLFGQDSLTVNSFHHQAVKDPAPGINITARSADGLPEAFETGRVWAVQFHPEKMLQQGDSSWISLFGAFVRRCGS